jgi:hypothetical protein
MPAASATVETASPTASPSDTSAHVIPVKRLQIAAASLLTLTDPAIVDITLAVVIANELEGDPVWLGIVSPPSNGKTELTSAASRTPRTSLLSSLTPRTLVSGQKSEPGVKKPKEPSQLDSLNNKTLILKDFTTILTLRRDDRNEIFGILREVYDGKVVKSFGTGKVYTWTGKMGLLFGVTPTIDRHWSVLAALGERFLFYRLRSGEKEHRREQALKALHAAGEEMHLRKELGQAMQQSYKAGHEWYGQNKVTIPSTVIETLIILADLTAKGRTPVLRDGQTRAVISPPEPEGPGRLVKQLRQLALALSIIHGKQEPGEEELAILRKVARDTMPPSRMRVLAALAKGGWMTPTEIEKAAGLPHTTTLRELEDYAMLDMVERKNEKWQLTPDTQKDINESGIFFSPDLYTPKG